MPNILTRIVALLLIPALTADPALASHFVLPNKAPRTLQIALTSQALEVAAISGRKILPWQPTEGGEFSSNLHSQVAGHVVWISNVVGELAHWVALGLSGTINMRIRWITPDGRPYVELGDIGLSQLRLWIRSRIFLILNILLILLATEETTHYIFRFTLAELVNYLPWIGLILLNIVGIIRHVERNSQGWHFEPSTQGPDTRGVLAALSAIAHPLANAAAAIFPAWFVMTHRIDALSAGFIALFVLSNAWGFVGNFFASHWVSLDQLADEFLRVNDAHAVAPTAQKQWLENYLAKHPAGLSDLYNLGLRIQAHLSDPKLSERKREALGVLQDHLQDHLRFDTADWTNHSVALPYGLVPKVWADAPKDYNNPYHLEMELTLPPEVESSDIFPTLLSDPDLVLLSVQPRVHNPRQVIAHYGRVSSFLMSLNPVFYRATGDHRRNWEDTRFDDLRRRHGYHGLSDIARVLSAVLARPSQLREMDRKDYQALLDRIYQALEEHRRSVTRWPLLIPQVVADSDWNRALYAITYGRRGMDPGQSNKFNSQFSGGGKRSYTPLVRAMRELPTPPWDLHDLGSGSWTAVHQASDVSITAHPYSWEMNLASDFSNKPPLLIEFTRDRVCFGHSPLPAYTLRDYSDPFRGMTFAPGPDPDTHTLTIVLNHNLVEEMHARGLPLSGKSGNLYWEIVPNETLIRNLRAFPESPWRWPLRDSGNDSDEEWEPDQRAAWPISGWMPNPPAVYLYGRRPAGHGDRRVMSAV